MVFSKHDLEQSLFHESNDIKQGALRDDNPIDRSDIFKELCDAARRGDLKECSEALGKGANPNARDEFDYSPLVLASLCGHIEVCRLLLESGCILERDSFVGERCLYNALTPEIRKLLIEYDYSKAADPLQPLASHITSLLTREAPKTADISMSGGVRSIDLHKFILSARSPYFRKKLHGAPETAAWKTSTNVAPEAVELALSFLYLGNVALDPSLEDGEAVLAGVDKLSKHLEVKALSELVLETNKRKLRQKTSDEIARCRDQLEVWFSENVIGKKLVVEIGKGDKGWIPPREVFADVILQADDPEYEEEITPRRRVLYPVHRAMLLRSDVFATMFSSSFLEAEVFKPGSEELQVIPMNFPPEVVEVILRFLYTEDANIPLQFALEVLFAADQYFLEKLKSKAALVISTSSSNKRSEDDPDIDIYDVVRAGWLTRVRRLEEFGARYIADRLEDYLDQAEFSDLIQESANRIENRQETDTVELIDDIRYYLDQRFRLRLDDLALDEVMDEEQEAEAEILSRDDPQNKTAIDGEGGQKVDAEQAEVQRLYGDDPLNKTLTDVGVYNELSARLEALLERLNLDV